MAKTNYEKDYPTLLKNVDGVQTEMTPDEYAKTIAQWQVNDAAKLIAKAEADAQAIAKAALLERLGITEVEANLLLS